MTTTDTASGAIDFTLMYATHDAFRRDLDRMARSSAAGAPGFDRTGWLNFKRQLHVHHTVEDTALWPRLRAALAGRPRDLDLVVQMEAEHARLDSVLGAVDEALAPGSAGDLAERISELSAVLGDHMKHEEDAALPLIQQVLTAKDWGAFRGSMARTQGPRGAAAYVPWIVDGVSADVRKRYLGVFPAPVRLLNSLFWEPAYRRRHAGS
ncbi:MAG: hemerythrin domain-containing protein [Actinocrinis sp.]